VFLVVLGIMAIFSASAPKCIEAGVNPAKFAITQMIAMVVGLFGMKFFANYDYKKISGWALPFGLLVVILLALVDFTPLGVTVNGAKRWLNLGIPFQPSELAKPAVAMLLASAFYRDSKIFVESKFRFFVPILIMVFLIFKQPNLSMVILLFSTALAMFICAGGSIKLLMWLGGIVATGGVFLGASLLRGYQMSRITTWLNPEADPLGAGYNIIQSLVAFATGGFYGVGFGASKQKLFWLPEAHTDFIFAVIGEELGFIGCLLVIGLFWTLLQRGFIIANRCPDMYGKLLAAGLTFSLCFQAFINMSVASSLIPATGVPLPFISYGGSSLVVSMCMVGILLNISKKRVKRIRAGEVNNVRRI